jgi:hypothetical protein
MSQFATQKAKRAFVHVLEAMSADAVHESLRKLSTDDLCALNEHASRRLRDMIQREIRNTDDL